MCKKKKTTYYKKQQKDSIRNISFAVFFLFLPLRFCYFNSKWTKIVNKQENPFMTSIPNHFCSLVIEYTADFFTLFFPPWQFYHYIVRNSLSYIYLTIIFLFSSFSVLCILSHTPFTYFYI